MSELSHLTGRIGELYTAMITRGQMAKSVNQQGYDVVSAEGERIQVKTVTTSTHATFRKSTINNADRVVILKLELDEDEPSIVELLNASVADLLPQLRDTGSKLYFPISRSTRPSLDLNKLKRTAESLWNDTRIVQLENGTIVVERAGVPISPAKPALRQIARDVGVNILNPMGNAKNTRTLGSDIIKALA